MLWICSWIRSVAPAPTPTMAITAATPMMMPSIVSAERMRFTFSARSAIRTLVTSFFMTDPRLRRLGGKLLQIRPGIARVCDPLVPLQPAIFEMEVPVGIARDVRIVRHHDHGDPLVAVQPLEDGHDLEADPRVQRAGWLVRQDDARVVHQRPRDGHALLLAAGELARLVFFASGQSHREQRLRAPARGARAADVSVYSSGSSTFSVALVRASRLNCWKTNPIFLFRISASSSLSSAPTLMPSSV